MERRRIVYFFTRVIKLDIISKSEQLDPKIINNLILYLEKNVPNFPRLDGKTVEYSYVAEYRLIALWWSYGSKYNVSEEFYDECDEFDDYVLDYDTEGKIKGIEIFEFFPDEFLEVKCSNS
jgi:hypothetical protein